MWLASLFTDERGSASSKRVVGILAALAVCGALVASCLGVQPDPTLTGEVLTLALGALGLTSIDKRNPPPPPVMP
jgi:hypothetical protein